jgi:hypothetical protein
MQLLKYISKQEISEKKELERTQKESSSSVQ